MNFSLTGDLAQGTCGIDVSNVEDVDIGTWVCAGKLQSGYSELSDTFNFSSGKYSKIYLIFKSIKFQRYKRNISISAPAGLGLSFILLIGTYVAKILIA